MKSKLKILLPLVLVIFGATYKFVLAKPAPEPHHKIAGEVYVLPKDFLINLNGGRFAKLGVALVLAEGYSAAPAGGGHEGAAPAPPEGYGTLPQEPVVRSIITDELTDAPAGKLTSADGREKLQKLILKRLENQTDVKVDDVLFTDVAVQ
jgi:flagellar basal body-associated protein FliL